jgi:RNA polymerase sigma factor (sigma-70 family)
MGVSDEKLVVAALGGDPAAFARLVEQNRVRVEAVVARMVGDEAEDLVQEALLRAYLSLTQLRDPARFGTWLCQIAINLAKMRLRRRALEARVPAEPRPTRGAGPDEWELLDLVRDGLAALPAGQREAVLLHYIDGLSCEEIADLLDSSPGAIRVRLHRARRQLYEQLSPLAPLPIPKEEVRMIEMKLEDVLVRVSTDDATKLAADMRIVLLKEADGDRRMPMWIGAAEGNALALRLTGETTPRPVTSDVMAELLRVTGTHVERVAVTRLLEKTFYAVIGVAVDGRVDEVDARPSDALNLAVRVGAPIFVEESVLEQCALPEGDVPKSLDADFEEEGVEVPPGEWRSLSAQLLRSLYRVS